MAKRKEPTFGELLLKAAHEAAAHARGERVKGVRVTRRRITAREADVRRPPRVTPAKVRRIREQMEVSQPVFADLLGVSKDTVQAWEQGKRNPEGASLRLLELAEKNPEALLAVTVG
ncbi:MAG: helix-turn-helix domain-containing protein [Longimicrobiales bacterium]